MVVADRLLLLQSTKLSALYEASTRPRRRRSLIDVLAEIGCQWWYRRQMYGESDGSRERDGSDSSDGSRERDGGRSGERDGAGSSDICRENTTVVAAAVDRENVTGIAAAVTHTGMRRVELLRAEFTRNGQCCADSATSHDYTSP